MTIHLASTSSPRGPLCGEGRDGDATITASSSDPFHDRITCAACQAVLAVVKRAKCNLLDPDAPSHLPHACIDDDGHEGLHGWERDRPRERHDVVDLLTEAAESYAASHQREAESMRESEERMHPELVEPVEASTPSGLLGRWIA